MNMADVWMAYTIYMASTAYLQGLYGFDTGLARGIQQESKRHTAG